jgi:radical SAM enzyme (rSAM/lipoprotein system)
LAKARKSILRHLLNPIYKRLETTVHPLRYLFVEITQKCNLACRHCGSDCTRYSKLDELSTDEWLNFFTYLKQKTDWQRMVLIVTGGEPFCHPEFDRILEGLKSNQLAWGMVTNGFALSPANIDKIIEHGMTTITVSLDGLADKHDWLRGKPGSFKRAMAGIERLASAQLPFFDVVSCVHPGNLDQLDQILALLQKLDVPAWRLFSIFPKGRAKQNNELLLSAAQFRQLLDFIKRKRVELKDTDFQLNFSCEGYLPGQLDRQVRDEPYFCRAGINIGSVLCDGSISACPNISRSLIQGNIRKDDFIEVWKNRYKPFRERSWMKTGECRECNEFKHCQGNSMHLWDAVQEHTCLCTFKTAQLKSK